MPLPPALAARLAQRGLINPNDIAPPAEEVIAEDYDDQRGGKRSDDPNSKQMQEDIKRKLKGYPGCPNKNNINHECTEYCLERYGNGHVNPDPKYLVRKQALLQQFPIPEGWDEAYDPGTGRFYFWNIVTDMVSWWPPGHPNHIATDPACVLREEAKLAESEDEEGSASDNEKSENDEVPNYERRNKRLPQNFAKGRNKKRENDLDPMDPASYSEIPRGTWSSGLMVSSLPTPCGIYV